MIILYSLIKGNPVVYSLTEGKLKKIYFLRILAKHEIIIWAVSVAVLILAFILSGRNYLNLLTSIIGVTALIYLAKGEPLGQMLSVLFSIVYAIVSYSFRYYGEMITYLAMTLPSSLFATIIWLKHPYKTGSSAIQVGKLSLKKIMLITILTPIVTFVFYFILAYFKTPHLIISTISIATSFTASMFTFFRSRLYALAYSLNDIILIILWSLASKENIIYLPMVICFIVFLINDLYAFFNWKRLEVAQNVAHK